MVIAHQRKKITNGKKTNGILWESLQTFPDKIKWKTQGPRLTGLGATNLTRKEVKLILKPSIVMERSQRWFSPPFAIKLRPPLVQLGPPAPMRRLQSATPGRKATAVPPNFPIQVTSWGPSEL